MEEIPHDNPNVPPSSTPSTPESIRKEAHKKEMDAFKSLHIVKKIVTVAAAAFTCLLSPAVGFLVFSKLTWLFKGKNSGEAVSPQDKTARKSGMAFEEEFPLAQKTEKDPQIKEISKEIDDLKEERIRQKSGQPPQRQGLNRYIEEASDKVADLCLKSKNDPKVQNEITTLQQSLHQLTEGLDLQKNTDRQQKMAKRLVENFSEQELKGTFKETIASICHEHRLSPKDINREAMVVYNKDENLAMMKMVSRLIVYKKSGLEGQDPSFAKRKDATGFELSTIKGIEKAFKNVVVKGADSEIIQIKDTNMSVIPTKKGIVIEEKQIGKGGFKVAVLASDYFTIKKPEDRNQYVSLKPKLPEEKEKLESVEAEGAEIEEEEGEYNSFVVNTGVENEAIELPPKLSIPMSERPLLKDVTLTEMKLRLENLEDNVVNQPQITEIKSFIEKREIDINLLNEYKKLMKEEEVNYYDENKDSMSEEEIKKIKEHIELMKNVEYQEEINITKALQGENIIKMHSVIDLSSGDKVMIQEAAGYTLKAEENIRTKDKKVIDLKELRKLNTSDQLTSQDTIHMMEMFLDGFKGVKHVHDLGYIHRDLKEENILITKDGRGVLADFGTVVAEKDDPKKAYYIGTPHYSAPETFKYDNSNPSEDSEMWNSHVTKACDIWSCGMMIQNNFVENEDISTHLAILDREPIQVLEGNKDLDYPTRKAEYEDKYPEPKEEKYKTRSQFLAAHLVWSCTRLDPEDRPSIDEFIASFEEIIKEKRKEI